MGIRKTVEHKINFDKMDECGYTLIASAGDAVLKKCFDDNRPPKGPNNNNNKQ
jgi:hypothetical protein